MAKREKPRRTDMSFDEALRRFAHTDPAEIDNEIEKVRQRQEEVRGNIEKTKESIRRGARRAKTRFRI
jgi:hypothetical protein